MKLHALLTNVYLLHINFKAISLHTFCGQPIEFTVYRKDGKFVHIDCSWKCNALKVHSRTLEVLLGKEEPLTTQRANEKLIVSKIPIWPVRNWIWHPWAEVKKTKKEKERKQSKGWM